VATKEEIQEQLKKYLADKAASVASGSISPPAPRPPSPPAKPAGTVRLTTEQVGEVYHKFFEEVVRSGKTGARAAQAAEDLTKAQVGPGNFAVYKREVTQNEAEGEAQVKAQDEKEELDAWVIANPVGSPYDNAAKIVAQENAAVEKLCSAHNAVEVRIIHLRSGGTAGDVGAGVIGLAGVGVNAVNYSMDKANPVTYVAGKVTHLAGKVKVGGTKETSIKDEGGHLEAVAKTSVDIADGRLGQVYDQTRPAHKRFQDAAEMFGDARQSFGSRDDTDNAWINDRHIMDKALKELRSADAEYNNLCASLEVLREYENLQQYNTDTGDTAAAGALEIATSFLGDLDGEVGTFAKEEEKDAVKGASRTAKKAAKAETQTVEQFRDQAAKGIQAQQTWAGRQANSRAVKEAGKEHLKDTAQEYPEEQVKATLTKSAEDHDEEDKEKSSR
jgi:hypothetical protein